MRTIPTIPKEHIKSYPGTDGDVTRPLKFYTPCSCGCDNRNAPPRMIGYVSGGNGKDLVVTIILTNQRQIPKALEIAAELLIPQKAST